MIFKKLYKSMHLSFSPFLVFTRPSILSSLPSLFLLFGIFLLFWRFGPILHEHYRLSMSVGHRSEIWLLRHRSGQRLIWRRASLFGLQILPNLGSHLQICVILQSHYVYLDLFLLNDWDLIYFQAISWANRYYLDCLLRFFNFSMWP